MTRQKSDYMYFERKKYTLIAVEKDKDMKGRVKFIMPPNTPSADKCRSSACWMGYTMDYHVIRNSLYGAKKQSVWCDSSNNFEDVKSAKAFIPFTGSCIIANGPVHLNSMGNRGWYIYGHEAFELYFEQGKLKERLPLTPVMEKAKAMTEGSPDEYCYDASQIVHNSLKYKYMNY